MSTPILRITDAYPTVLNDSFDYGIGGWTTGGTNTIESSDLQSRRGSKSLKCTYIDNLNFATVPVTFPSEGIYIVSADIFVPSDYDGANLRIIFTSLNGQQPISYTALDISNRPLTLVDSAILQAWQRITLAIYVDGGDLSGFLKLSQSGASTVGRFVFLDGVRIESGNIATPFVNAEDTTTVSLISSGKSGFFLDDVNPSTPSFKRGGDYRSSPFTDGRQIVDAKYDNIIETYELKAAGLDQDEISRTTQDLRKLLAQATNYWINDWDTRPVWIEAKGSRETYPRYAIIQNGMIAEDTNHWATPFVQQDRRSVMDSLTLIIERDKWLSERPGIPRAVPISAMQPFDVGDVYITFRSGAANDDCQYTQKLSGADVITLGGATFEIGCSFSCGLANEENESVGLRFRRVVVDQGATIASATLYVTPSTTDSDHLNVDIHGDDTDNAAIFTTTADWNGRAPTTATTNWIPGAWTANTETSVDVTSVVQEIVNRGGWASGNNMAILLHNDFFQGSGASRHLHSFEAGTAAYRPRIVIKTA